MQTQQALYAVDHIDGAAANLSESFTEEGLNKLERDARRVYWHQVLQELQRTVDPEADIAVLRALLFGVKQAFNAAVLRGLNSTKSKARLREAEEEQLEALLNQKALESLLKDASAGICLLKNTQLG